MALAKAQRWLSAALVIAGQIPLAMAEEDAANRILFSKYSDLCLEVARQSADNRDMVCTMLDEDEASVRADIQNHVAFVCENLSKACKGGMKTPARYNYARRSQTLGCAKFGFECPIDPDNAAAQRVADALGDINILVELIEAAERGKFRVPPALKFAIITYVEARDLNREIKKAIDNVNAELKRYYSDAEIGCREDSNFIDDPPPNACTAAIDRRTHYDKLRAVLDWSNKNSVVSQVTRARLHAWDLDRIKSRAMNHPSPGK